MLLEAGIWNGNIRIGNGEGYDLVVKICKSHYERSGWDLRKAKEGYGVFWEGVSSS
jgi:hypothetical protein